MGGALYRKPIGFVGLRRSTYNIVMSTTDSSDNHQSLKERVQNVIDRIRPAVQGDGGDIELVDVVGDTVKIRFHGACHGCPSSTMTLQYGIERNIREKVPEVKAVIPVA